MAVKVNSKGLNFKIEKQVKAALQDRTLIESLAKYVRDRIYQFTKRGISLATEGKLKPLSPRYVKWRRKVQRGLSKVKPGPFFSAARSNLTLTGQMLDALDFKADPKRQEFTVFVQDSGRDDDLTNAEVAKEVAKFGRPFIGLDKKGVDVVTRKILASLRRSLKR